MREINLGKIVPQKGVDYLTQKEINNLIQMLTNSVNLKPIMDELEKIKKEIEGLRKQETLGRRTLHRGGIDFVWNELVGTGDNTTTQFTLDYTPYSSSELQVWVGGGIQFLTDDFTLSGKTLTFLTPPPTDAKIRATYRK